MKTIKIVKAGLVAASLVASGGLFAAAPTLTTEVVVSKLDSPWDMSFLKDGTVLIGLSHTKGVPMLKVATRPSFRGQISSHVHRFFVNSTSWWCSK